VHQIYATSYFFPSCNCANKTKFFIFHNKN